MFLGALVDLGVDPGELSAAFRPLPPFSIDVRRVEVGGITAALVNVTSHETQPPHRTLPDVRAIVGACKLSSHVADQILSCFVLLATAEAKVHGTSPDKIHFHEVGATDALVDIMGTFWGFEQLGVSACTMTAVPWGMGTVRAAHGPLPLPAPATLELLRGLPLSGDAWEGEWVTPTGAAILASCHPGLQPPPGGILGPTGCGAGTWHNPHRPNVLRISLVESVP